MTGASSRRRGAKAERDVVAWLNANGWPYAERRLAGRSGDTGDFAELGPGLVLDVKNRARMELAQWVDQLEHEMDNADAEMGALIVKRRGRADVGDWYGVLPMRLLAELLRDAGWSDPKHRQPPTEQ